MPKYKKGDVASLFPAPKEPKSESGKKLQSLFSDFHSKKNKPQIQSPYQKNKKMPEDEPQVKISPSPSKKQKKRKFSEGAQSSFQQAPKRFKSDDSNGPKPVENLNSNGSTKKLVEFDFPRKKNKKAFKNSLVPFLPKQIKEQRPNVDVKSPTPLQPKGFIKKSKSKKSDGFAEAQDFKIDGSSSLVSPPKYKALGNNSLIECYSSDSDIQVITPESIAKFAAKSKKKEKRKKEEVSPVKGYVTDSSSQSSQEKNQPDFISLPHGKPEKPKKWARVHEVNYESEEALSRTLFVGNLPTNVSRNSLRKAFSVFGQVVHIRYHPVETDRRKIFQNDKKVMTSRNFAGPSVPAYVVFKERQSAVNALALSGSIFQNRHITVDFASPAGTKKLYDNKRSIFIGNLPFGVEDESIWNAFAGCGKIDAVRVVRDSQTGIGKGFGYVQFASMQGKDAALGLGEVAIEDRKIRIKAIEPDKKKNKSPKSELKPDWKPDTFKSRAIREKKSFEESHSRKSVKKIMKKNKMAHNKKKIAAILQKSMA